MKTQNPSLISQPNSALLNQYIAAQITQNYASSMPRTTVGNHLSHFHILADGEARTSLLFNAESPATLTHPEAPQPQPILQATVGGFNPCSASGIDPEKPQSAPPPDSPPNGCCRTENSSTLNAQAKLLKYQARLVTCIFSSSTCRNWPCHSAMFLRPA